MKDSEIPESYRLLVGKELELSGHIFSHKKKLDPTNFTVVGLRWGTATVMNVTQLMEKGESDYEHPTVELLLSNDQMKRRRWTNGFPVREINLKEQEL